MPQFRKVAAAEATSWRRPARRPAQSAASAPASSRTRWPSAAELDQLLGELDDRTGLTRLDRAGNAGGEHGWRARVYTRGVELHQQFSDARYGGTRAALLAAVAWRDAGRRLVGGRPQRRVRQPRIARAEYRRMCGWLAYSPRGKRYFADGAWGGREAAEAAARAWLQQETACEK